MAGGLFLKIVDSFCLSYRLGHHSLGRDIDQAPPAAFIPQSLKKSPLVFYDGVETEVFSKKPEAVHLRHHLWSGGVELEKISEYFFLIHLLIHEEILKIEKMEIPGPSPFRDENITGFHI